MGDINMPKRAKQTIIRKNEGTWFSGKTFSQYRLKLKGLGLWSRTTSPLDYEFMPLGTTDERIQWRHWEQKPVKAYLGPHIPD